MQIKYSITYFTLPNNNDLKLQPKYANKKYFLFYMSTPRIISMY